jgi:hypothetical protein
VFGFDLQFLLAGLANPVVFSFDEGVIVNTEAVVVSAKVAFHVDF